MLGEAVARYLAEREVSGVRSHTVGCERSMLKDLLKRLGDRPVDQFTVRDVEAAIDSRRAEGLSTNTLNHMGRNAKRFFKWVEANGLAATNPIAGLRVIKVEQARITPMTREQVARLMDACDTARFTGARTRMIILLLFDTGLRASEALGIRLSDVDQTSRCIKVIGKGRRSRNVFFGKNAAAELKAYLLRRGDLEVPWLFPDEWGTSYLSYNGVNHVMQRLAKKAGIDGVRTSCHTLRHSFAREFILNGGDVATLSELLGHSSLEMTSRYVHMLVDDVSKVHERVSPGDRLAVTPAKRQRLV
jgi:integrase/recombinase XerD